MARQASSVLSVLGVLMIVLAVIVPDSLGFAVSRSHTRSSMQASQFPLCAKMENDVSQDDRLQALGYSTDEIQQSRKQSDPEPTKVRVDLVDDVDSVSLTAIGFALIAFNFFVLANLGDGGIAGFVATIMNAMRS